MPNPISTAPIKGVQRFELSRENSMHIMTTLKNKLCTDYDSQVDVFSVNFARPNFGAKYGKPSTRDFINKHLRNVILMSDFISRNL